MSNVNRLPWTGRPFCLKNDTGKKRGLKALVKCACEVHQSSERGSWEDPERRCLASSPFVPSHLSISTLRTSTFTKRWRLETSSIDYFYVSRYLNGLWLSFLYKYDVLCIHSHASIFINIWVEHASEFIRNRAWDSYSEFLVNPERARTRNYKVSWLIAVFVSSGKSFNRLAIMVWATYVLNSDSFNRGV